MADERMAHRPLLPLVERLSALGARIESIDPTSILPLVNWGGQLRGGIQNISAETTSQFASAVLLIAPYADDTLVLRLPGTIVGREYVHLTVSLMQQFGAQVSASADMRLIEVRRGGYQAREITIGPDVTSLFYFIAAAVIVDTDVHVANVFLGTDPALDKAVAIGRALGVQVSQTPYGVQICSGPPPRQRVELQVEHVPTLVPALAALAASLPYGLRITGAQHIQFHKTSRLAAVLGELEKIGHQFDPIYERDALDGFETMPANGRVTEQVDSHGDHRLFMALFLACLRAPLPTYVSGQETLVTSFPEFVECFAELGAQISEPIVAV
jgi:3-phosphoshikimate 1-carboxyvinyltransferase